MKKLFSFSGKVLAFLCLSFVVFVAQAQTPSETQKILPAIFADHMVLQRNIKVPVWGFGKSGEKVTIQFAGQTKNGTVESNGKWRVDLDPLTTNDQSQELTITIGTKTQKITDVLVGEVWVASGQSNMASPVSSLQNAKDVLAKAEDTQLRFFTVTKKPASEPQTELKGKWELSNSESAKGFSAVAYFFAAELRKTQKCPVAVLHASWGGTSIETWISLIGLKQSPAITKMVDLWEKAVVKYAEIKANPKLVSDYEAELKRYQSEIAPVYSATMKLYNDSVAKGMTVGKKPQPSSPEPSNPDPMGMPSPSKRPSTPTVNFNGMIAPLIPYAMRGVIWYQGENDGGKGFDYRTLMPRLVEDWRKLWNQPADAAQFPFLWVQLPSNGADKNPVAESGWPFLREAQLMSLRLPKTGMAITIDVGDPKNVHPADKFDVGQRLSLVARKVAYGEKIVASGPLYQDFKIEKEGKIRLTFKETGSGLVIGQSPWYAPTVTPFPKDKLIGFFIAGSDKKWVEADAQIDGNSVIVSSQQVANPVAVRYGWANSPRCNLYNKEGLPASPFRTDVE